MVWILGKPKRHDSKEDTDDINRNNPSSSKSARYWLLQPGSDRFFPFMSKSHLQRSQSHMPSPSTKLFLIITIYVNLSIRLSLD